MSLWTVETAERLARAIHAGQTDKIGNPYIGHVERVARYTRVLGGNQDQRMAAWLHDAVEDSPLTLGDLVAMDCPVVPLVDAMTFRKGKETRRDYYERILSVPGAKLVKHADLLDNTDPERIASLEEEDQIRLTAKYQVAWEVLGLDKQEA